MLPVRLMGVPTLPLFRSLLTILLVTGLLSRKRDVLQKFIKKPGQTPTFSMRPVNQPIDVDSPSLDRSKSIDDNDQEQGVSIADSKKKRSITATLKEGATEIKFAGVGSSSKHEPKKRKQEGPKRANVKGSVIPPLTTAPKGVGKHSRVLARHMRSLEGDSESLVPDVQKDYSAHNMLSGLHYPLLKNKLESLSFDDLINVYDVHALQLAVVANMLINESRIVSRDYSKLKYDFVSLRIKSFLRRLHPSVKEAEHLEQRCWDLEAERDFLPSKESEEITALSSKLKIADLERVELALDEVHGLGDSWEFKSVKDYHPNVENIFNEAAEAIYKLEFPYISLLVEKVGQSLGELTVVYPPPVQEATSL
nr:hypothetical protein [Tanacetum cinerariifolium]